MGELGNVMPGEGYRGVIIAAGLRTSFQCRSCNHTSKDNESGCRRCRFSQIPPEQVFVLNFTLAIGQRVIKAMAFDRICKKVIGFSAEDFVRRDMSRETVEKALVGLHCKVVLKLEKEGSVAERVIEQLEFDEEHSVPLGSKIFDSAINPPSAWEEWVSFARAWRGWTWYCTVFLPNQG